MRKMKIRLLILLGTLSTVGCATLGGDMIVRASGSVPASGEEEKPGARCELGMVSAETGKPSSTKEIPSDFSTSMMVVAGRQPKSYYFVAVCGDGRRFRSNTVTVSSRSSHTRSFDLGTLVEDVP